MINRFIITEKKKGILSDIKFNMFKMGSKIIIGNQ